MKNRILVEDRSGIVNCLGWCNKTFKSPDRISIRFCKKCTEIKDSEIKRSGTKSRRSTLDMQDDD